MIIADTTLPRSSWGSRRPGRRGLESLVGRTGSVHDIGRPRRIASGAVMSDPAVTVGRVKTARLFNRIIAGAVTNVGFSDLIVLLEALGFNEVGGRGSHRVFARPGVVEILTLQELRGQAKPYQVRQVAAVVRRYNLQLEDEA